MVFTELRFFVFLALVLGVHWAARSAQFRKVWLLAWSLVFYGAWDWRFLGLMAASIVVDYVVAIRIDEATLPRRRRLLLSMSLVVNLGILFFFKYCAFFTESAASALAAIGLHVDLPTLQVVLPVGISFYTFQTLSYTIDVYRREMPASRSLLDFALFVSFFPQLVAGPIVRAADFIPQLSTNREASLVRWRRCAVLFFIGFVKKAVIADHVAKPVDAIFGSDVARSVAHGWLGAALYAVQIYCDFSGYSDMAIALAGMFGYRLTRNFDAPYLAGSVTEFWRRWHISLSTWFRDYLYIPLGGSRHGTPRTVLNLVIVFLLCGLWHGASATFVVWGAFHGLALLIERVGLSAILARLPAAIGRLWTLGVVLVGWVFFRAHDLSDAMRRIADMFGSAQASSVDADAGQSHLWWAAIASLLAVHLLVRRGFAVAAADRLPPWGVALGLGILTALMLPWIAVGYVPFIYFQF